MRNVMLDLETMGTRPTSAITAIGAVIFDPDTQQLGTEYHRIIHLESCEREGFTMDASTVLWWLKQSPEALAIYSSQHAMPIADALQEFSDWLGYLKNPIIWGNGSDFDNLLLSNAYKTCKLGVPWKFWNNRCYRTMKSLYPHVELTRVGTHHNALDDAKSQALHLMRILNDSRSKT